MRREDLRPGHVYVVAGRGELLLRDFSEPPACVMEVFGAYAGQVSSFGDVARFEAHGGGSYWATPEDVVREATRSDLEARDAEARPRGVACDDLDCWCRAAMKKE